MTKLNKPDAVLAALLDQTTSLSMQERLRSVHALCEARHAAGEHDFTRATIGKLCEAKGIMGAKSLQGAVYPALIAAWSAYSEGISLGDSNLLPPTHPVVVLKALLSKDLRGDRKVTLRNVHEVCKQHHATGSLDFEFSTMGKLFAAKGIIEEDSLKSSEFTDLRKIISAWADFARPWLPVVDDETKSPRQKQHDIEMKWVQRDHPEFEEWRALAVEWLAGEESGLSRKLAALARFFEDYLVKEQLPASPAVLLARGEHFPAFRETACPTSSAGVDYNNAIHGFLNWVLIRDFSIVSDYGVRVPSPAFRNPVPLLSKSGTGVPDESVRSPLPYGYIDELRRILAPGLSFKDWTFAQNALGVAMGEKGAPGRDWFDVTEDMVDRSDPDCVLRVRVKDKKNVLQMWSPVRWVAVLVKLLLPLRSTQVRLLDSGEADTWRLDGGVWAQNIHPLAAGTVARPLQQGVLRRVPDPLGSSDVSTVLYINTNKTADKGKEGLGKGYVMPWFEPPSKAEDVFYWLERLRNWQERYNPLTRKTSWTEMDGRHIKLKSAPQLAGYSDACFLFRLAESNNGEAHLPVSDGVLTLAWCNLLEEMSSRLAARGDTHADGSPIKLATVDAAGRYHTAFPLHSLRVSLITALALDGKVPFPILQKLVGHSRLLMTLYYFKPGNARVNTVLQEAAMRLALDAGKEKGISEFLLDTDHDRLVKTAICNSASSLAAAIPEHPGTRNAAGWMLMHHGLCLVGGNTSEIEDNRKVGGCHNGGPSIGNEADLLFGPVPGGSRNCIRCRWFVTEPHHLPALVAHFNTLAYHFDEARNKSLESEQRLQGLKREKAGREAQGVKFENSNELAKAERLWEANLKRFSDLAEDLVACWRLIERCRDALAGPNGGMQMLVQGALSDVQAIFEETESELLQLSGVCESLELYPDLEADKAILRRSQLLDSALYNEGLPPLFMQLSEGEQLLAGNSFMRRLALQVNPDDPALAQRQVIALMDAGKSLGEHLGIEVKESFLAAVPGRAKRSMHIPIKRIADESTI